MEVITEITNGGAHVSLEGLGNPITMTNSTLYLRAHGKHIQVGLVLDDYKVPSVPIAKIVG